VARCTGVVAALIHRRFRGAGSSACPVGRAFGVGPTPVANQGPGTARAGGAPGWGLLSAGGEKSPSERGPRGWDHVVQNQKKPANP